MNAQRLVILGFGGHARSVADVALVCGYSSLLFVDSNARDGEHFMGHPVVAELDVIARTWDVFPGAGDNATRKQQCREIARSGVVPVTLISPLASVGVGSTIGVGCFVGHHAHIGPMAKVEEGCIINTGAIIEHESEVGAYAHVSVNATIAGRSALGSLSMLGAGATIIDRVKVGDGITIGAGAVVHRSISAPGTYVGVPAVQLF
ncbi:UDP-N-acetylbacillosamine N-acetyltransferase [Stutzerimonas stutzeri]|uniref:NeuD/PglB/VioB family sugar acetyltransferase n=1 Tax=Stutzerimonas stutzeri TaxID=316 RepID=UPI001647D4BB|nr:NeuD/PglB/VioB family sugar acetyltransferase [Stutzerimonas stutzeri]CAD2251687.1 UDP-N-acetylbacillosamine N-acetyltransferase [Stutzerimonas stutzeri]